MHTFRLGFHKMKYVGRTTRESEIPPLYPTQYFLIIPAEQSKKCLHFNLRKRIEE